MEKKKTTPNVLYKYISPSVLELILKNKKLKFSTPGEFNDPFDCNFSGYLGTVDMDKLLLKNLPRSWGEHRSAIAKMIKKDKVFGGFDEMVLSSIEDLRNHWDSYINKYRVLCLTPEKNNILLWSHYAVNHTGTVLGIDFSKEYFFNEIKPVEYPIKNTMIDDFIKDIAEGMFRYIGSHKMGIDVAMEQINAIMNDDNKMDGLVSLLIKKLHPCFYVKKSFWSYEEEFRYVKLREENDSEWLNFDINSVSEVVFGIKTSTIEQNSVINIIKECGLSIPIYKACKRNAEIKFERLNVL